MLEKAIQLRNEGLTYHAIAKELNTNHTAIQKLLKPEYKEKQTRIKRDIYHSQDFDKKTRRMRIKTEEELAEKAFRSRCKYSLKQSRTKAKRDGYTPCTASVDNLVASFTGYCQICEIPEAKCSRKLCMDHCHKTGRFKGWLCVKCNLGLGYLEDHLEQAIIYLSK